MTDEASCFITLEGIDGAGKSTHMSWLHERLTQAGIAVLCTREPGGTALAEQLRELLLNQAMDARTEALLMFAARNEHWLKRILPALQAGTWVVCDRFLDASYAYQGGGRGLGAAAIDTLAHWLSLERAPDCTFLFDVPATVSRERVSNSGKQADRFEREQNNFFERTRQAYLEQARRCPERFHILDAQASVADIRQQMTDVLHRLLQQRGHAANPF